MRQRTFVFVVAGSLLATPFVAEAQPAKTFVLGFSPHTPWRESGDLPVEQPPTFELVGLTIPPSLIQRADQVIE